MTQNPALGAMSVWLKKTILRLYALCRQLKLALIVSFVNITASKRNYLCGDYSAGLQDWYKRRSGPSRIALIVLYNHSGLLSSLSANIKVLIELGFAVVVVANRTLTDRENEFFAKADIFILSRSNIGADIGAYKDGLWALTASRLLHQLDYICLCNDSLEYTSINNSQRFISMVSSQLLQKRSLIASHESYQPCHHYQSFFLIFSRDIFLSNEFSFFWKNFKSFNNRLYIVNEGEIGFSRKCLNYVEDKYVICSYQNILRCILTQDITSSGIDQPQALIAEVPIFERLAKESLDSSLNIANDNKVYRAGITFWLEYISFIIAHNPSHTLAFLALYFGLIPWIKLDLIKAGSFRYDKALFLYSNIVGVYNDSHQTASIIASYQLRLVKTYGECLYRI